MAKFKYHSRKFLNKKEGIAAIESTVASWDLGDGIDGNITISDCNRNVSLDFSVYDVDDLPTKYMKLGLLLEEVKKMHDYYTNNYAAMAEDLKQSELKRKEWKKKKQVVRVIEDEL